MSAPLENRLAAAFREADRLLRPGGESTAVLRDALEVIRSRAADRMRVAVVGRVSSGKSTLVNALIGEECVATGSQELTFNVNRLRYGSRPGLMVHYKDGRPPAPYDLGALMSLTARRDEHMAELRQIREVVVEIAADYLRSFELIDTPGLDSVFGDDSLNTLRFLGMAPGEVRASTLEHSAAADALLLVVPIRGVSRTDTELLDDFLGDDRTAATPLNTLGVLTKCEHDWEPGGPDPLIAGRRLAERTLHEAPGMQRRLYDLTPVCSLVGLAASTLDAAVLEQLTRLAKAPPERFAASLEMAQLFVRDETLPLEPADRRLLWRRFGAYGLHTAVAVIRDGCDTVRSLSTELSTRSGMDELRGKIVDHFGHRAALLKFDAAQERIARMPHDLAAGLGARDRAALNRVIGIFTRLALNEPGVDQLRVLHDLYTQRLAALAGHEQEIRRILGERGRQPYQRLGLPPTAPAGTLRREAGRRQSWWAVHWMSGSLHGPEREATRIVLRAYEHLLHELGR